MSSYELSHFLGYTSIKMSSSNNSSIASVPLRRMSTGSASTATSMVTRRGSTSNTRRRNNKRTQVFRILGQTPGGIAAGNLSGLVFDVFHWLQLGVVLSVLFITTAKSGGKSLFMHGASYLGFSESAILDFGIFCIMMLVHFLTTRLPPNGNIGLLALKYASITFGVGAMRVFTLPVYSVIGYCSYIYFSTSSTKLRASAVFLGMFTILAFVACGGRLYADSSSGIMPLPADVVESPLGTATKNFLARREATTAEDSAHASATVVR